MNNATHGEAMPKTNPTHRQRGQLVGEIIQLLIETPCITLNQMACRLDCGHENIRRRYVKIQEDPAKYAAMAGFNGDMLREALRSREEKLIVTTRQIKKDWRGKADWPAKKVARNLGVGGKDRIALYAYKHPYDKEI